MTYEYLRYFVETCRCGSLYQAAKELYISPQGVSQGIKRLEDSIGIPLFDRTQNSLEVTPFGREFLSRAEEAVKVMNNLEEFARARREAGANSISVALMGYNTFSYLMLSMIENFQRDFPDCRIGARIYEPNQYDVIFSRLDEGTLDVAWTFHTKRSEKFEYITIREEDLKCLVSADSALAQKEVLQWTDLKDDHFMMAGRNEAFPMLVRKHCLSMGFEPKEKYYSTDAAFVARTIASGQAVGIFYTSFIKTLQYICPNTCVKAVEPGLYMGLSLFYSKEHPKSEMFAQFLTFAGRYLRDNLRDW